MTSYQDNFAIFMLSMFLLEQHNTLDDMGNKLFSLEERADSAADRQQQFDDFVAEHRQAVVDVDTKLRSLMGRVDGQQFGTNAMLLKLVDGFGRQREALGQVAARVHEVSDRVDSMATPERLSDRISAGKGVKAKRAAMLDRMVRERRLTRKRSPGRGKAGKR